MVLNPKDGFIAGFVAAVVVTLVDKAPDKEVEAIFDRAAAVGFDD